MRLPQHGLLWAVVVMLAGCTGGSPQQDGPAANEPGNGDANTADVSTEEIVNEGAIAFDDELPKGRVDPSLLPATSPEQRVAQITTGRSDPFSPPAASLTIVPTASTRSQSSAPPLQPVPLASLPNLPPPPLSTVPIPVQPLPGNVSPAPDQVPAVSATAPTATAPAAPAVPAVQTVEVNGVVQVGGLTRAIVTTPNEGSGRSVGVGDRIANGQVLVKRIDIGYGGNPVVVLEQNGVEVVRSVSLTGG